MACVDQQHAEPTGVEQLVQRDPVHAGGFHGHCVHAASGEPIGELMQVGGEAFELAHWFIVPIRWHRDVVRGAADIDAGGIGMGDRKGPGSAGLDIQAAIALRQGLLHHRWWNVALDRVRRRAHSLKRDIGPSATNRRDDSPMSMTSPRTTLTRGQCAPLLYRSSPAPHSTLPQSPRSVFLRRDLRQKADYYANLALNRTRGHTASSSAASVAARRLT